MDVQFVSAKDIKKLINFQDVLENTEKAYAKIASKDIINPPKVTLVLSNGKSSIIDCINSMPAHLLKEKIAGIKWVNVNTENKKRKLPVSMGTILLNDAQTGKLIAVLDGTWITYARTAASVVLGAKYLAKKNSKTVGLIGAGDNAKAVLLMLVMIFPHLNVNVTSRTKKSVESFIQSFSNDDRFMFTACDSVESVVKNADIIILTTTSNQYLMKPALAKPGDFISSISALRDVDPKTISAVDRVVFDHKKMALKRIASLTGDVIEDTNKIQDLCEIILHQSKIRKNDQESILYLPAGLAGTDIQIAYAAYKKSLKLGIGKNISLFDIEDLQFRF